MWKISSEKATVHILGSMHFANEDLYPLNQAIQEAFNNSDTLVLEINPLIADQQEIQKYVQGRGFYSKSESITDHITPDVLHLLESFTKKYNIQSSPLYKMKPGLLALSLTSMQLMELGYRPENGIDYHFARQAGTSKQILELESVREQLSMLFSMPDENQFLRYTLLDLENLENFMDDIIMAWTNGDQQLFYHLIMEPYENLAIFKPYIRKLYENRNLRMASKIKKYLKTGGTYFVVVGAGHLVGEKSILNILDKQKYTIEQVSNEE